MPPATQTRTTQVAAAAFGSSAAMATSSSNGGLPSGRSRSPGFDVDKPTSSSSPGETTASSAAAAAFLAGATVVTGSAPGAEGARGVGGGWLGAGDGFAGSAAAGADSGGSSSNNVDHAFAGAMLQRSTSAPPVSDHVSSLPLSLSLSRARACARAENKHSPCRSRADAWSLLETTPPKGSFYTFYLLRTRESLLRSMYHILIL